MSARSDEPVFHEPGPHEPATGEPEIPAALASALRALERGGTTSARTDRRVLAAARERIGIPAQPARPLPRRLVPLAAAAAVLVGVVWLARGPRGGSSALDLDGSGRVDVLDGFLLARSVRDGVVEPEYDVNGDGVVDRRDVELVLAEAVRL